MLAAYPEDYRRKHGAELLEPILVESRRPTVREAVLVGHRSISADGEKVADVYLMYNSSTGRNCVTLIKRYLAGSPSAVRVELKVQGSGTYSDPSTDIP